MIERICAVDPGGEHVGVAIFARGADSNWRCQRAAEYTPADFEDWFSQEITYGEFRVVVVEEFRLYPDKARAQTGSTMPTAELIGVIKYVVRMFGGDTKLVLQPAAIKVPTRSLLREHGIKSVAKKLKAGGHAADAELHGWCYLLRATPG